MSKERELIANVWNLQESIWVGPGAGPGLLAVDSDRPPRPGPRPAIGAGPTVTGTAWCPGYY
jgi:hypothetical protein